MTTRLWGGRSQQYLTAVPTTAPAPAPDGGPAISTLDSTVEMKRAALTKLALAHYWVSGLVLVATAVAKLATLASGSTALRTTDPVIGISNGAIFATVAVVEVLIVQALVLLRSTNAKNLVLLWFGGSVLLYRLAALAQAGPAPCSCLGTFGNLLPVSPATIQAGLTLFAVYLVCSSALLLWYEKRGAGATSPTSTSPATL
jgi:hypothetical protein